MALALAWASPAWAQGTEDQATYDLVTQALTDVGGSIGLNTAVMFAARHYNMTEFQDLSVIAKSSGPVMDIDIDMVFRAGGPLVSMAEQKGTTSAV